MHPSRIPQFEEANRRSETTTCTNEILQRTPSPTHEHWSADDEAALKEIENEEAAIAKRSAALTNHKAKWMARHGWNCSRKHLKLAITEVGNEAASSNPTTSVDGMMQKFSAIQSTNLNSLVHSQVSVSSLGGAAGSIFSSADVARMMWPQFLVQLALRV
ncbi:hypothetical protein B0H14DRAFT_2592040 [Mycena olivaceomarginata]|nr:hypothetical protein B0H14DRAFT_2592040 [Mycena olivaceomarginata]